MSRGRGIFIGIGGATTRLTETDREWDRVSGHPWWGARIFSSPGRVRDLEPHGFPFHRRSCFHPEGEEEPDGAGSPPGSPAPMLNPAST
jgi:hypothetical protein